MSSAPADAVSTFVLRYRSASVPPPNNFTYVIEGSLQGENLEVVCHVDYMSGPQRPGSKRSRGTPRDIDWQGTLPTGWQTEAVRLIAETDLRSDAAASKRIGADRLEVTISTGAVVRPRGEPVNRAEWLQFANEILQAARYELGYEEPGVMRYAEVKGSCPPQLLEIRYHPVSRTAQLHVEGVEATEDAPNAVPSLDIQAYRRLLLAVGHVNFYGAGRVGSDLPSVPGAYLDRGGGQWYAFDGGIRDPSGRPGATDALQSHFTRLLQAASLRASI